MKNTGLFVTGRTHAAKVDFKLKNTSFNGHLDPSDNRIVGQCKRFYEECVGVEGDFVLTRTDPAPGPAGGAAKAEEMQRVVDSELVPA